MRDFVSRTLSLFVGLVLFVVFMGAVLYYTTPPWMRQLGADSMRMMEQIYSQPAQESSLSRRPYVQARAFCLLTYPELPWEERAAALDDRGRGRRAHPEIPWNEYDRLIRLRGECEQSYRR